MAKKTKTDASTAAYKMAAAKLLERHRALKVALTQDLIGVAAEAEKATAELEQMNRPPETPVN